MTPSIGPFLAAIGATGFILGFALQGTLSNFAAGLMILLYRPYDIGDSVNVAGTSGTVSAMSLVSTTLLLPRLDPFNLGALLALYEHKVFVESVIWDVNPFDQWGVELGKVLAGRIIPELESADPPKLAHDSSTNALIEAYRRRTGKA